MSETAGPGSDAHAPPMTRQRVVMLVNNPCTNDSRVIREAEALAAGGHDVTVLCRLAPGLDTEQTVNGVVYRRLSGLVEPWVSSVDRQQAWHATQRARKAWHHDLGTRLELRLLSILAYACTWRRNVGKLPPNPPTTDAATSAEPAESAGSAYPETSKLDAAPANEDDTPSPSVDLRSKLAKIRYLPAFVFSRAYRVLRNGVRRLRKALQPLVLYLRRLVIPIVLFEDVDVAMSRTLNDLKPTVIHAHDLVTLPTAARIARRLKTQLVYDSHELELHRNAPYSAIAQWWRARMESRHIVEADLVITVSDSIADHLAQQYQIPRPLVVLNAPSFDVQAHEHTTVSLRTQLGLSNEVPLAVYVGRVTFGRGVEFCVQALAHHPELHVATVGPREAATENRLNTLAEKLGVTSRLHLVDPVPPNTVVPFIRDADVSLLPIQNVCLSYYYCMPNKLLESVTGGVPVAVANLIELRNFVEKNRCGVVMDETNPVEIAQAIRRICDDRASYCLDDTQINAMKQKYSWETQARTLLAHYPLSVTFQ